VDFVATLGAELKRLRLLKGVTLRQVEKDTRVSNAYLSQLENEKAEQPSPRVLNKLAEYYEASYTGLMQLAGYLVNSKDATGDLSTANGALLGNLTSEEEAFLATVLEAYRANKAAGQKQ
jgi:transcriptional regulator with XRE-family HTH domain